MMEPRRWARVMALAAVFVLRPPALRPPARAGVVVLGAVKDTTLIEDAAGGLANGGDPGMFVGRTLQPAASIRRALIAFDVAGAVPPGVEITSVSLELFLTKTRALTAATVGLHRVLAEWGEGSASGAGMGGPAAVGDATWLHRAFPTVPWMSPGGDFVATSSGVAVADQPGVFVVWQSTPRLISDVQSWLDAPAGNFGWLLLSDETTAPTARLFDSHEGFFPSRRPRLTIQFRKNPCVPADVDCDGRVNGDDVAAFVAIRTGAAACAPCAGDLTADGMISDADIPPFVEALLISPMHLRFPR